jgi:glycosyltransferase involved in cell wall biosynthesis
VNRSIVFVIPSLAAGGAERQLIVLAGGLQRSGWRVRVITFYGGGSLAADLLAAGVPLENLEKRGRRGYPVFVFRLLRALRRERPGIVHAYLLTPNILTAILKPFLRGARVVWGVRASNVDFTRYGRGLSLVFGVSCWLARFADLIISNSTAGVTFHASNGYPETRMVVIPNGIDGARFAPDGRARVDVRAEWQIGADEILVGLVGRLDPMKDHPTFLDAARIVATARRDVRFVCVGNGPPTYRETLERRTAALGLTDLVIWAGGRGDLPRVYNAFDLAVSSSSFGEGFPNVVGEAMATAIPCVVTDVGDSAFVVGDTGWVCPPDDATALAEAILSAISSSESLRTRGELARRRVVDEFGQAVLEQRTAEQLTRLLA